MVSRTAGSAVLQRPAWAGKLGDNISDSAIQSASDTRTNRAALWAYNMERMGNDEGRVLRWLAGYYQFYLNKLKALIEEAFKSRV